MIVGFVKPFIELFVRELGVASAVLSKCHFLGGKD